VKDVKDFIDYHANKLGMPREEYVTYYVGEDTSTYDGAWKTYEQDLIINIGNKLPGGNKSWKKWVKKYEIKGANEDGQPRWEIKLKNNMTMIAQRYSRFGQYKIELDGKNYNTASIGNLGWDLMRLLLKPIEQYERQIKATDWYSGYADDHKSWKGGNQHKDSIKSIYSELSSGDKKKAYKMHTKEAPEKYTFSDFESFDKAGGR